ncbi:LacI family transcriptional regulator [Brachybacterium vulturis]|uniref:LacI family transcriptional regulator n=1 Tax=Brachybacterium vulturis TaxID=2017484 RepID=A0A291GIP8_9MICO|nr:LacI family DNA-binding transcriptional regulator [Brachybacterium vulturis]ATG50081.1 LacI family transcriptional regulator [Brachybacterium vulturis]
MTQHDPARTRATMRDVARLAGVSKTTVSRVLNGSDLVTDETRTQVEDAMQRAGYVVSYQARSLATGRSDAVALLVTEPFQDMWTDPTFASILGGTYSALSSTPMTPLLLQASSPNEQTKVRSLLEQGVVDGIIHLTPYVDTVLLEHLSTMRTPTVLCGRLPGDPYAGQFSTVYADDEIGARLAATRLAERGREHPVALLGPRENPANMDRLAGYRAVLGELLPEERVRFGEWDERSGHEAATQVLATGKEVDALLCASDRIAVGALEALQEAGLRVPEDVSVIGFDDHPLAARSTPPLTTVAQPMVSEGEVAVGLLKELLEGGAPRTEVLPMELRRRASA